MYFNQVIFSGFIIKFKIKLKYAYKKFKYHEEINHLKTQDV